MAMEILKVNIMVLTKVEDKERVPGKWGGKKEEEVDRKWRE